MPPRRDVRVVICEDDAIARLTLARLLQSKPGIEVVGEVSSAEELETALDAARADVILLDVNLPGRSGVEFLRAFRRRDVTTPVIAMSADEGNRARARAAGATRFFSKGRSPLAELVDGIHACAGGA